MLCETACGGPVAQRLEQWTHNPLVPGSNPGGPTILFSTWFLSRVEESMAHNVFCVKLKKELPGLDEPPFDNELGQKVYQNVSQEAWRMWMEHCKMLLNEYR